MKLVKCKTQGIDNSGEVLTGSGSSGEVNNFSTSIPFFARMPEMMYLKSLNIELLFDVYINTCQGEGTEVVCLLPFINSTKQSSRLPSPGITLSEVMW